MQRNSILTLATVRRLVLALALVAPVALVGSALAQNPPPAAGAPAAAPDAGAAPAAAAPAAPAAAAPAAPAAAASAAAAPAEEPAQLGKDLSVTGMVKSATTLVKIVMVVLSLLSVWSWAIMLDKTFVFAG